MIFIISHHPPHRDQLLQFFDQRGFDVCLAPHRENVCDWIKQINPHVVVLDAFVASPNPIAVLRSIRSEGFKGKVILLANPSIGSLLPEIHQLGIDQVVGGPGFPENPINFDHLESSIRVVVHPYIAARAHDLFIGRGSKGQKGLDDWLQAEREILFKKKT
ncbi:DUF2934 domain-containing protein [Candidatus Nitronereus thalassa]|uniref:DUF2934 domain-containing protein n=1 Tax=Candidatus Nitronereus thalassa TaxID=3020898 RepID=A0ABU3K5V0_9BACT|nr:DUF2934 domain-containing protein [Candidatus Nitronereus thalassa]MDT7041763.1 DUF2934 domain-containing protein [Candidatus Nitronereus thalassa]